MILRRLLLLLILTAFISACGGGGSTTGDGGPTSGPDPFFDYAWHLHNTGQKVFAPLAGIAGEDIHLSTVNSSLYTGKGIRVLVSDDGLESSHEDLRGNFLFGYSKNFYNSFPYTASKADPVYNKDNHGTSVAGLIVALANNGRGSRGVAPEAQLCVANFLSAGVAQTTSQMISQAQGDFDIFNQSWGAAQDNFYTIDSTYEAQLRSGVTTGRDGKGSLYLKAAGNDWLVYASAASNAIRIGNANLDGNNTLPYLIVVGASNARGFSSSYSSPGSSLWVSAPGGEFGGKSTSSTDSPAMITTDRMGCSLGYAKSSADSSVSFESGGDGNTNCNYTATFNGTSSATPVLAGSLALLLQANPLLTWRDVKHILASTSTQPNIAVNIAHPQSFSFPSPGSHIWEQGWRTNGANYKFQNWYGFGNLNMDAALAMALSYNVNLGTQVQTIDSARSWYYSADNLNLAVPDFSDAGVTSTIEIKHNYRIEAVQIRTRVTHPNAGQLGVELTSPSGMKSILLNVNNSLDGRPHLNMQTLLSNAFYGESSAGTWTLKIIDGKSGQTGTLNRWDINIIGHVNPDDPDTTAPDEPTNLSYATNDSSATSSPTITFVESTATDLLRYEYSIGTTAGNSNIKAWTPILTSGPSFKASGLTLTSGTTYYLNMRAIDHAENISPVSSSSGWTAN